MNSRYPFSFVWLLAYDWKQGCEAIARLWSYGEEHIVGWDAGGVTWGGGHYTPIIYSDVMHALHAAGADTADIAARVRVVLADFHRPGVHVADLETAERNALSWLAKPNNKIITLDADEEPVNFEYFADWFKGWEMPTPLVYRGQQLPVYKVIGDVALVFQRPTWTPIAMGSRGIFCGPRAGEQMLSTPLKLINWFLAGRSDEELRLKFAAMSYMEGNDPEALLELHHRTTLDNYGLVRGFSGTYNNVGLVPISLADLRAGRWEAAGIGAGR
ncbi:MAG TPA: hypothetical protein VN646_16950 [Candidatus Acidoferrum sp.]|nr:hypothetical protein [Candidatus Acidoferrum sp.]